MAATALACGRHDCRNSPTLQGNSPISQGIPLISQSNSPTSQGIPLISQSGSLISQGNSPISQACKCSPLRVQEVSWRPTRSFVATDAKFRGDRREVSWRPTRSSVATVAKFRGDRREIPWRPSRSDYTAHKSYGHAARRQAAGGHGDIRTARGDIGQALHRGSKAERQRQAGLWTGSKAGAAFAARRGGQKRLPKQTQTCWQPLQAKHSLELRQLAAARQETRRRQTGKGVATCSDHAQPPKSRQRNGRIRRQAAI